MGMCVVIGVTAAWLMASETLSFRITRNTEDLAQTIHSLSQRLVKLEQRLAAMELQLDRQERTEADVDPEELVCLDNVERLLADCRELLEIEGVEPASSFADCDGEDLRSGSAAGESEATVLAA
jgi:hypothetical protein